MIDDPYKNLANAIIVQAAKDYQKALRQLQRNPKYEPAQYTKNDISIIDKFYCRNNNIIARNIFNPKNLILYHFSRATALYLFHRAIIAAPYT